MYVKKTLKNNLYKKTHTGKSVDFFFTVFLPGSPKWNTP